MTVSLSVARKVATRLFAEAQISLPVDLEDLVGWRGLSLTYEPGWPDTLCARYLPVDRKIEVNVTHRKVRQRFSVAHELGHFALGHEQIDVDHGIEAIFGDEEESFKV